MTWESRPVEPVDPWAASETWRPAADVCRTRTGWLIKLELAGVRREDVHVELQGRRVRVAGLRRDWLVQEPVVHHRLEIRYTRFVREILLPEEPAAGEPELECREGILLVYLPGRGSGL